MFRIGIQPLDGTDIDDRSPCGPQMRQGGLDQHEGYGQIDGQVAGPVLEAHLLYFELHKPDRPGTARKNVIIGNVLVGDAAIMHHMHLPFDLADLAGAAKAHGAS
ncbi:hypothetical protein D3C80_87050 [compost metagenome]